MAPKLPLHIYQRGRLTNKRALAEATIWVSHVKTCQFCLQHLVGINQADAVDQYFASDLPMPEDIDTVATLKKTIRPTDKLFDTKLEVLCWYLLITAPQ